VSLKLYYKYFGAVVVALFLSAGCNRANNLKMYDFGGDFTLTDHNGKQFDSRDLRGKTVLLFFGFTLCPDICPTTLSKLKKVYGILGERSENLQIVFITVDPERDTPEKLQKYLEFFDMGVLGLTGSINEIRAVTDSFHARFDKVEVKDSAAGYLMEHSASTYLIDKNGKVRYLFRQSENPKLMASIVEILLDEK